MKIFYLIKFVKLTGFHGCIYLIIAKFLIKTGGPMHLQNAHVPVILISHWTWKRYKRGQCGMQVFEIGILKSTRSVYDS